jgi:FlaA1/EpsC-like NDP-sugar epimerase
MHGRREICGAQPLRVRRGGFLREGFSKHPRSAAGSSRIPFVQRGLRAPAGWLRHGAILLLDSAIICVAFYLGFAVRFEGQIPSASLAQFWRYLPLLLAIRLPLNLLLGIHRWSFRFSGLYEAMRVVLATLTGSACFVTVFYFIQRANENIYLGPPRSVVLIEFFMTTTLMGVLRFSPRFARVWFLGRMRSRDGKVGALIVGAGSAGELLLRDLQRSKDHSYEVVGFVDDDRAKRGLSIGGRPVLGSLDEVAEIARSREVRELLFTIPSLPAARLREILNSCAELKLSYKILPVSYTYLSSRVKAAMLRELEPEHLLPRDQVHFDEHEMRALIEGRRILVTGAGGSIGSEICRSIAARGPASLVLLDMNENELYLLYRELQLRHPEVALDVEVADIRDRPKVLRVGRKYLPQDVFHAAAHKHVPLMEDAPEEAIKNNVFGCLNVLDMAEEAGTSRFVLISTDKAVRPSSVMGASKKIAEMMVRERTSRLGGGFTAVRFGNVLGSAGSVVPLFKAQIAQGGPVTVTHHDCRRYLMTVGEAVGLVLLAGLGGHGDLCVLEMGEPIRILDLARLMITMAGLVPDQDIRIVFTGLRPGEKLEEELLTEEELRHSRRLDRGIRVILSPPPSASLMGEISRLEAVAQAGDRATLVAALQSLLPDYLPMLSPGGAEELVTGQNHRNLPAATRLGTAAARKGGQGP